MTGGSGPRFREAPRDCPRCPRLVAFRHENRARHGEWHNAPVPAFGSLDARLLVVGLAPGRRGANRTGRPFTGDFAGAFLFPALAAAGFANDAFAAEPDDGLELRDCRITNAVRCVPPENKPTGAETASCRLFLVDELAAMPNLAVILALGAIAHRAVLAAFGLRQNGFQFGHGALHELPDGPLLADSYHCSRQNTNTGRLTVEMFAAVLREVRDRLARA